MSYFPPLGQPSTEGWPQPGIRTRMQVRHPDYPIALCEVPDRCKCGGVAYYHAKQGKGACDDCGCLSFETAR